MRKRGARVLGPYPHGRAWQLILIDADGERGVETVATKSRGQARRKELEAELVRVATTLDEAIDAYERHLTSEGNRPGSVKLTIHRLRRFFGDVDLPLQDLTLSRARACYAALAAAQAVATHRNTLAEAKTFGRWCVAQRWLARSPIEDVAGKGKRRRGKKQLRIDEARRWRARAHELARDGEVGAVAALMTLLMGLRASEVVFRVVRDVDDDGRVLWIEDAKTEAGNRTVRIPVELRGYIRLLTLGRAGDEPLWLDRHWRDWPREWVQRICGEVGVPEVTAHGMRGLAATLAGAQAILAGGGLDSVADALGHEETRTTETAYADRAALGAARQERRLTVLDGGEDRSLTVRRRGGTG